MLKHNQHLNQNHAMNIIISMVTADYYYPDWAYAVLMFLQAGIEKVLVWLGIEPVTLDLSSQSGAYDHWVRR